MTTATPTTPTLADTLRDAEQDLASSINATANHLDGIGNTLPSALANLERATQEAKARLQAAAQQVSATLGSVATFARDLAGSIMASLTLTQPAPTPIES